jgi:uroporphyrinogen-III synthase
VGTGNDPAAIARRFVELVDGEIILFPQAIDSFQTVQRWLPFNNIVRNLFVYKTQQLTQFIIPETETLVFTSPSNVNAYFSKYTVTTNQRVIAIGTSTKLSLRGKGIGKVVMPESFDEESLLERVLDLAD